MNLIKKTILIPGLIINLTLVFASNKPNNKFGAGLQQYLLNKQKSTGMSIQSLSTSHRIHVHIRGSQAASIVEQHGGLVMTIAGDIITASIPVNMIDRIANQDGIKRMTLGKKYTSLNDMAATHVNAKKVHQGLSPLSAGYTGENVIIGIIDTGIDVTHPDFQNPDGSTRILALWDQDDPFGTGMSGPGYTYDYGKEWTKTNIDAGLCTHTDTDGHGTHVAGSAAGNGSAVNAHKGIAYNANLIIVAMTNSASSYDTTTSVLDATNYIFKQAKNLGRPAVINMSFGSHMGPHDGTTLEEIGLSNLVTLENGHIICAAAGNEGESSDWRHLSYPVSTGTQFTYFHPGSEGYIEIYARIPSNSYKTAEFAIGVDQSSYNPIDSSGAPMTYKGASDWYTAEDIDNLGGYKDSNFRFNLKKYGRVEFYTELLTDSTTGLAIIINDNMTWTEEDIITDMDLWRLMVRNISPKVHIWKGEMGAFYPMPVSNPAYHKQDGNLTVGMPATADNIIAVGASINRNSFTDIDGTNWEFSGTVGDLASFSSRGPRADGIIKPDIVAPGRGVISALSENTDEDRTYIMEGGKHSIQSGTSMASPVVTGCIALYLQKNPNATYSQVYQTVTGNSKEDGFTGSNLPNNDWGYGKMDIFQMFTTTSIEQQLENKLKFQLSQNYPNPFNTSTMIRYQLPAKSQVKLHIYDACGNEIIKMNQGFQDQGWHTFHLDGISLASGLYIIKLQSANQIQTKKMLLLK